MSRLLKRFPGWAQILPVYAVIALIVYAWTLLWFFWRVPGWLAYLNVGDILGTLVYLFATNLAESLVVLGGVLALAAILPGRWFRDVFVPRGVSLCIAGLGYLMFLADRFKNKINYPALPLAAWTVPVALLAIAVIVYACGRFAAVRRVLEAVADRATIFVYILVPLSILSLAVILINSVTR